MKHQHYLVASLGILLSLGSIASADTAASKKSPSSPNILIVLVDDMGTEDTSVKFNYDAAGKAVDHVDPAALGFPAFAQDNSHYITPHMETLASQGMKFSRAYACQVCSPTRVTLMTGQNSSRHGTFQWIGGGGRLHNLKAPRNGSLKTEDRTIAEVFRDAGYRTIAAGKGHMGTAYNNKAINYKNPAAPADDYYGFQVNVSASATPQQHSCYSNHPSGAFGLANSGVEAGFVSEYQNKTYHQLDPTTYPAGHAVANEPIFVTEALTREMNERIEDSVAAGKPFFAYMSHYAVHDPHQPDPRFTANYPKLKGDVLDFATMIEGMDKSLGDILAKLDALGVAENTLVIFLGDNGSDAKPRGPQNPPILTMSNPLRGEKGNAYEGGIRVPLIFAWAKPDANNTFQKTLPITPGSREHDIVSVQDLYPTLLSIAGIPLPTTDDNNKPLVIDGADLKPYLLETPGTHRPQTLITHAPCSSRSDFFTTYHEGDWKLIYGYTHKPDNKKINIPLGSYELYNLGTDMHEAKNLATTNPKQLMHMAQAMAVELKRRGASYPTLKAYDASLDSIGMPSGANDPHPVILPTSATVNDLAPSKGTIRRDPSDVIKVDDTYYVYYSKMVLADEQARTKKTGTNNLWPEGYNADVWGASSTDEGKTWKELGPMILRGKKGEWDSNSAFTPNIVRLNDKYYLYYTAVGPGFDNRDYSDKNKTAIGLAISDSPAGPFKKIEAPVFEISKDHKKFDSFRIDDSAIRIVKGKVWLYYKGRAWEKTPGNTKMGLAIADKPEGPFVRFNNGDPIQNGGHEVMVWEHGNYIFNYVSKTKGQPSTHIRRTTDGFSNDAPSALAGNCRLYIAPGLYRPELTGDKVGDDSIRWGVEMKYQPGSISLKRYTIDMKKFLPKSDDQK